MVRFPVSHVAGEHGTMPQGQNMKVRAIFAERERILRLLAWRLNRGVTHAPQASTHQKLATQM